MCAVGVKESASICAELLDDFLRRHRALCDDLLGNGLRGDLSMRAGDLRRVRLNQVHRGVGFQVLHHALRNKNERAHKAKRQQHPKQAARHIDPEVSEFLCFSARDAANDHDRQHDPGRRRNEVVISQPSHLRQVAHCGFAAVHLPIRVRRK